MTDSQTGVAGAEGTLSFHSRNNEHDSNRQTIKFSCEISRETLVGHIRMQIAATRQTVPNWLCGHLRDMYIVCEVATVIITAAITTRGITPITITGIE